jgi:GDP-mannose 6-dehydrogenase
MNISIMGLGYVGTVSAVCLARLGHKVLGIDSNSVKVELINSGFSPIVEAGVDSLLREAVNNGQLRATMSFREALEATDLTFVCVGTPSNSNGSLDLTHLRTVCEQIGEVLADKPTFHTVVIRSTVLPGSVDEVVIPLIENRSKKRAGSDFGVCMNPEFLREGTALFDFENPPKTVIGELDERSGDTLQRLYQHLDAPLIRVDIRTAEMVKYSDNVWHALKVCFANEIGNICKESNIDSHKVMEIFCTDTKLNLSSYYLKPGFAFGGSCLPKDVRALTHKVRTIGLETPVLSSILRSNEFQIERALRLVLAKDNRKIGVLGFSFKEGTDDLRESPIVELIERLLGKGFELKIYDKNVNLAKIGGANRNYIINKIPHISRLMADTITEVLEHADTLIIGNKAKEFADVPRLLRESQTLIDLVRLDSRRIGAGSYEGICW